MKKQLIFTIVFSIVAALFLVGIPIITANQNYAEIKIPTHSETKAICTQDNFCEDYELFCKGSDLISLRATGFAVQFPQEWQDPRTEEQKEISC